MKACLLCLLIPLYANAKPSLHVGPSASLMEARLSGNIFQLTPGLGVQGWIDFNNVWSLDLGLWGSALGLGTAHPGAALSAAPFACFSPYGACLGPLFDVFGTNGGLADNFTWKKNFGIIFQIKDPIWNLLHLFTN